MMLAVEGWNRLGSILLDQCAEGGGGMNEPLSKEREKWARDVAGRLPGGLVSDLLAEIDRLRGLLAKQVEEWYLVDWTTGGTLCSPCSRYTAERTKAQIEKVFPAMVVKLVKLQGRERG
jgi:hypothetical protein